MTSEYDPGEAVALARSHLGAWIAGDIEGMGSFTSDAFVQWHSMIRKDYSKTEHSALLREVLQTMTLDYHDIHIAPIEGGALVRCLCDISVLNGPSAKDVPFALVYRMRGGKIYRCDEYMDGQTLPNAEFIAEQTDQRTPRSSH